MTRFSTASVAFSRSTKIGRLSQKGGKSAIRNVRP